MTTQKKRPSLFVIVPKAESKPWDINVGSDVWISRREALEEMHDPNMSDGARPDERIVEYVPRVYPKRRRPTP